MKVIVSVFALCAASAFSAHSAHAQTTFSNLDADPITNPNQTSSNLRQWGYSIGSGVGCASDCTPSGSMSHTNYYSVDGSSIQMNLANPEHCITQCFGDLDFSNKLYQNNTAASSANNFTLDVYVTGDSLTNTRSQALEFTIEQDVPSTQQGGTGQWDRYIYSWQCNYKGNGFWNLWDGTGSDGTGKPGSGAWVPAVTTSGATVPCAPYTAGNFIHYYFHFLRLPATHQVQFTDFTTVDNAGHSSYHQFNQVRGIQNPQGNWGTGVFTAIQLDGDSAQEPYSLWADQWTVAYSAQ